MVKPRVCSLPKGKTDSLGDEAVELAAYAGLELDDWQQLILKESLKRNGGDRWSAFEVGVNVARQNGKGGIIEARILAELYLVKSPLTIYSAHNFDTAAEHFRRIAFLIEETPKLAREVPGTKGNRLGYGIRYGSGQESIELKDNRRLRFRTRTKGGGRGFTCDLLILDESMIMPEFTHGALLPTLSARPNPQVWYLGSSVDQEVHEHGVVFARVRARGVKGTDPSLAYFEWSVEGDNPEAVGDDVATDQAAWAQANPALGIRISPDHVAFEQRSMDPRTFAVERLGVGDWPRTDHVSANPLDLETWLALADETSKLTDPVCFAFDISPDRRTSIAAAGRNQDGLWHVEIIENRLKGTGWLAGRMEELVKKHKPAAVVCDGYGPAASLVPALEELGIEVTTTTAGEHAQACGRLVDVVEEGSLRHLGSLDLAGAVRAARTRPLGDAWAWSRKDSSANISPLVSVTLALSAAMTAPVESKEPLVAWG